MNKEIKAKWVSALRSGEYEQGTSALRTDTNDGSKYCCLGVLCDLAVKEGVISVVKMEDGHYAYDGNTGVISHKVKKWAGLDDDAGSYNNDSRCLIVDNDMNGHSFNRIADTIEYNF